MSNQGWGAPPPPPPGSPPGGFGGPPPGSPPGGFGGPPGGYPGPAPGAPFDGGPGMSEPWRPWEAITFAFDRIKSDPGTILGALIVGSLIANAFSSIAQTVKDTDDSNVTVLLIVLVLWLLHALVSTFMTGGMTLFSIKVARGEDYQFGDIFKGGPVFLPILGANILMGLGIFFGMLLLIVPGIFLALGWALTIPLIVDRQMGTLDAMKESWGLMTGHKGALFVWALLVGLLFILGLLACCIGVLVVGPIVQISHAFIYLRISGQRTASLSIQT